MRVYDGYPVPDRQYRDPYRPASDRDVAFFNRALSERGVHRPLNMSAADRNRLTQAVSRVDDFHQLFK